MKRDAPFVAAGIAGIALGSLAGGVAYPRLYIAGIAAAILVVIAILIVPWRRLPPSARAAPALAYFVVIALMQLSGGTEFSGYGPLTIISIIWIALNGRRWQLIVACAATMCLFGFPLVEGTGVGGKRASTVRVFVLWSLIAPMVGFTLRNIVYRSRFEASRCEAILRAATDHSVISTDPSGSIIVFNAGAEKMLGYAAHEMLGKSLVCIHDPNEIAERAAGMRSQPNFDVFVKICASDFKRTDEWSYIRKDGTRLTVMLSIAPLRGHEGEIFGYVGFANDVSRLRQAEASLSQSETRYRALADAVPQRLWTLDDGERAAYVNAGWSAYTGLTFDEALAGGAESIIHPDDRHVLERARQSDSRDALELRLRRHDGVYRWHLVRAVPLRLDGAVRVSWIVSATDIEERKAEEVALVAAHRLALEGSAAKTRFLATMSHEIRTPMSGVIGMCELLLEMPLGDEQRETAAIIHKSGKALLRIMNDILDFTKMEAGKLVVEAAPLDIEAEVQAAVGLQAAQAAHKRITLHIRHDALIPRTLVGDAGRLRQILINLINNAVKFTPHRGTIHVSSTLRGFVGERAELEFQITDTGIGIASDVRATIFDPFTQGDGSITRRYGGTGLGLTICKQLVGLLGGSITVDESVTAGTTMIVQLPFTVIASPAADIAALPVPAGGPTEMLPGATRRDDVRPERILLAEDNPINALLATKQLRMLGFEAVVAPDGKAVVSKWQEHPFDLILMDCHMPEMDGFAATRAIRRLEREHPDRPRAIIVAMTADARAQDREACTAAGMNDYIAKPAALADIDRVLGRWLSPAD